MTAHTIRWSDDVTNFETEDWFGQRNINVRVRKKRRVADSGTPAADRCATIFKFNLPA